MTVFKPIFFLLGDRDQDQDRDQDFAFYDLFVYDQGGGTPLVSDQDEGAGEEAESPAGGARGVGGVVGEGDQFLLRGPSRRPRQLHFAWRRLRVAQWTPVVVLQFNSSHFHFLQFSLFVFLYCVISA